MSLRILNPMNEEDKIATRSAYGEVLVEMGEENPNLVVMDADLSGSTKTAEFGKKYPERFFNMGIAEQNMYGAAAGLAHCGKVVCASTFAMFATGRAYEIVRNSIGYTGANVKICATHSGITVGEDGASHQTFEDMALMRMIPGMTVVCPSDAESTKELVRQAIAIDGPVYVRLGRSAIPQIYEKVESSLEDAVDYKIGKAVTLRSGEDMAIISTGIMVAEALKAAEELGKRGVSAEVVDMHTIKPIDEEAILRISAKFDLIITAEEHSVYGGLGSAVANVLAKKRPCPMRMVGMRDTFGESGKPDELMRKYGMTWEDICDEVNEYFDRK